MKVVVACDSFKGTVSSLRICELAERAAGGSCALTAIPIADGGEGTVDCFMYALGPQARRISVEVHDLYMRPVTASFCLCGRTAVLETASVAGLDPNRLQVAQATTYGLGQLILSALDSGARDIIIGLGGSGTNDCGMGMAAALGARFTAADGAEVPLCGEGLAAVDKVDISALDPRLRSCRVRAACDVDNVLYGPKGAAYVFAPQKGADACCVDMLDLGMRRFAEVIRRDFGSDIAHAPGSGAAGGLGSAVKFFLGGELVSGIDLSLDAAGFDAAVKDADLVITGEGCVDSQSLRGKAPYGVARRCEGKRVVCLCGKKGEGCEALLSAGISQIVCINPDGTDYAAAAENCEEYMYRTLKKLISDCE